MPVRILEKETAFHVGQRAPGYQPRSLELFKFFGLTDIITDSNPVPPHCVYEMPGGTKPKAKFYMTGPPIPVTPDVPYVSKVQCQLMVC